MLILWEYFWIEADWSGLPATAVTLIGPSAGFLSSTSTPFTVGANGSINGVLVVTLNLEAPNLAFGTLSQTVFSLSTGAATGTFTYTPTTLGDASHHIIATNNQAFASVSSIYAVSLAPITDVPSGGGGGHKKENYAPLPDAFWEVRERYLRRHLTPAVARVHIPDEFQPRPFDPKADQEFEQSKEQIAVTLLVQERNLAHAQALYARNVADLRTQTARTLQLTLDIEQIIEAYYMQAAIILLLDVV